MTILGRKHGDELEPKRRQRDQEEAAEADDRVGDVRDDRANADDERARARDREAEARDDRADDRETSGIEGLLPVLFSSRNRARRDRANAAQDRAEAAEDRYRARADRNSASDDRHRAAKDRGVTHDAFAHLRAMLDEAEADKENMLVVGRAQGQLMAVRGLRSVDALIELATRATRDETGLAGAAQRVLAEVGE